MDRQTCRSAWMGAGAALAAAFLITIVAGGSQTRETAPVPPATLQAPTPTLEPVSPATKTDQANASSASTPVQAHPNATPSQPKESQ